MNFQIGDFQTLKEINGQQFENQSVAIDGNAFNNCSFTKCSITYHGGPARLTGCSISPGCRFEFRDSAAFVLQILNELGWTIAPPSWMGPPSQTR